MDQRIFINKEKLEKILNGDTELLHKPIGYGYENDKPRALFVGTKRDSPDELQLTAKGDLQFNLKPVRGTQTKESEGDDETPPEDTQEDLQLNAAQDVDVDATVAAIQEQDDTDQVSDDDIPF